MKKIYLAVAICGVMTLGACKEKPLDSVTMACGDTTITATVYKNHLVATINEKDITMTITESADGAKFVGEDLTMWNKGTEWMLIDAAGDKEEMISCTAVPDIQQ